MLIALSGGDAGVARDLLTMRAGELTRQIVDALDRLGAADADAAYDIEEAFEKMHAGKVLRSVVVLK